MKIKYCVDRGVDNDEFNYLWFIIISFIYGNFSEMLMTVYIFIIFFKCKNNNKKSLLYL